MTFRLSWRKFLHMFGVHTPGPDNFCIYCGKPVWNGFRKQREKYRR